MIKILIADDHPIVRQGLKQIINEEPDMEVTDEAGDTGKVLAITGKKDFDIIILDISMPGGNGLELLEELKNSRKKTPVLMLTMHPEKQYAVRCLRAGASGYMTKETAPEELAGAIRKIVKGGKYISNSLAEQLAFELDNDNTKSLHEILSNREYHVMLKLASGEKPVNIAKEMLLSIKTISTYRTRILEKMKLKNNADLIHYAIKNNLLE